jgi:hypothetical protein
MTLNPKKAQTLNWHSQSRQPRSDASIPRNPKH